MASKVFTIWGGAANANVFKSLITAKYVGGVELKLGENFQMGVTNKTPEYMAKQPMGQVPLLETPEGPLFESMSIARFVARSGSNSAAIYGSSTYQTSVIDQWIDFTRSIEPNVAQWLYPLVGYGEFVPTAIAAAKTKSMTYITALDKHLSGKKFLTGDHVTLADICLFCALINPMKMIFSPEIREANKSFSEWWIRCSGEPNFKSVTGDIPLCTAELTEPVKKN